MKPDNVVLDKDGHACLTDFGLSKEGVDDNVSAKSFCGSVAYLAPEMLRKCGHGKAVDWYLLGVILYEILVGTPPYFSNNRERLFENIERGPLTLPSILTEEAKDLLKCLLQRNPQRRLGSDTDADGIKRHKFFKGINWDDVYNKRYRAPNVPRKKVNLNPNPVPIRDENKGNKWDHLKGWSFITKDNKDNNDD